MLSRFLAPALPAMAGVRGTATGEIDSEVAAAVVFIVGVYLIYLFALSRPMLSEALMSRGFNRGLQRYWFSDWGMDWLYDRGLVRPVSGLARADKDDIADLPFEGAGAAGGWLWRWLRRTESGRLRWYAGWAAGGAIVLLAIVMWRR